MSNALFIWFTKVPTWAKYVGGVAGGIFLLWLLWVAFWPSKKISTTEFVPAKVPSAVKSVAKQEVQIHRIVVYEKQALAKKIPLPEGVTTNPDKEVIAVADIPKALYGAETITVINKESGVAETLVKAKERPFASFESSGALGVRGGVTTRGGYAAEVYVRQDLFQIGGAYVNVYGAVEGDAARKFNAKAMIGVDLFRW